MKLLGAGCSCQLLAHQRLQGSRCGTGQCNGQRVKQGRQGQLLQLAPCRLRSARQTAFCGGGCINLGLRHAPQGPTSSSLRLWRISEPCKDEDRQLALSDTIRHRTQQFSTQRSALTLKAQSCSLRVAAYGGWRQDMRHTPRTAHPHSWQRILPHPSLPCAQMHAARACKRWLCQKEAQ